MHPGTLCWRAAMRGLLLAGVVGCATYQAIPLIVANPELDTAALGGIVRRAPGDRPSQQEITDLVLLLREGSATAGVRASGP